MYETIIIDVASENSVGPGDIHVTVLALDWTIYWYQPRTCDLFLARLSLRTLHSSLIIDLLFANLYFTLELRNRPDRNRRQ